MDRKRRKRLKKRRGLRAGGHGEYRSLQKRMSAVASEIKRFMVVSGALSLGSTCRSFSLFLRFSLLFLSSFSLLSLVSLPPPLPFFRMYSVRLASRLNPPSYFAAKIVERALRERERGTAAARRRWTDVARRFYARAKCTLSK